MLMGPGGDVVPGCDRCWARNDYEGIPPCEVGQTKDEQKNKVIVEKIQEYAEMKSVTDTIYKGRETKLADKMEAFKGKSIMKTALHTLIRHLHNLKMTEIELFNEIDNDGDGNLTRGEMQAALRRLGVKLHTLELDAVLRVFDVDGSGNVDFSEFYESLKREERELGIKDDEEDPRMMGCQVNSRIRLKATIWTEIERKGMFEADDIIETGTIMGPGGKAGTVLVHLDRRDTMYSIKPIFFEPYTDVKRHDSCCMCEICYPQDDD